MASTALPVQAGLFGDFEAGASVEDSVFRDATRSRDWSFPVQAGLGWRGRPVPDTQLRFYGRTSLRRYAKLTSEDLAEQLLEAEVKQRLIEPLSLRAGFEALSAHQPRFNKYDATWLIGRLGLDWLPRPQEAVRAEGFLERARFPRFDLDHSARGYRLEARRYMGLDGGVSLAFKQKTRLFSERNLLLSATGTRSGEQRREHEYELELTADADIVKPAELRAGLAMRRLRSNGDGIDYGPFQNQDFNTSFADDRIVHDYYTHRAFSAFLEGAAGLPEDFVLRAGYRFESLRFESRPARDAAEILLPNAQRRRDKRHEGALSLERWWFVGRFSVIADAGWSLEASSSNEALFDYDNHKFFTRLRCRF